MYNYIYIYAGPGGDHGCTPTVPHFVLQPSLPAYYCGSLHRTYSICIYTYMYSNIRINKGLPAYYCVSLHTPCSICIYMYMYINIYSNIRINKGLPAYYFVSLEKKHS